MTIKVENVFANNFPINAQPFITFRILASDDYNNDNAPKNKELYKYIINWEGKNYTFYYSRIEYIPFTFIEDLSIEDYGAGFTGSLTLSGELVFLVNKIFKSQIKTFNLRQKLEKNNLKDLANLFPDLLINFGWSNTEKQIVDKTIFRCFDDITTTNIPCKFTKIPEINFENDYTARITLNFVDFFAKKQNFFVVSPSKQTKTILYPHQILFLFLNEEETCFEKIFLTYENSIPNYIKNLEKQIKNSLDTAYTKKQYDKNYEIPNFQIEEIQNIFNDLKCLSDEIYKIFNKNTKNNIEKKVEDIINNLKTDYLNALNYTPQAQNYWNTKILSSAGKIPKENTEEKNLNEEFPFSSFITLRQKILNELKKNKIIIRFNKFLLDKIYSLYQNDNPNFDKSSITHLYFIFSYEAIGYKDYSYVFDLINYSQIEFDLNKFIGEKVFETEKTEAKKTTRQFTLEENSCSFLNYLENEIINKLPPVIIKEKTETNDYNTYKAYWKIEKKLEEINKETYIIYEINLSYPIFYKKELKPVKEYDFGIKNYKVVENVNFDTSQLTTFFLGDIQKIGNSGSTNNIVNFNTFYSLAQFKKQKPVLKATISILGDLFYLSVLKAFNNSKDNIFSLGETKIKINFYDKDGILNELVSTEYIVYKVKHNINSNKFTTTLELIADYNVNFEEKETL